MNKLPQPDKSSVNQPAPDSIQDRTNQQRDQDALRQSEEKYRRLFDSIDEAFCTIEVLFDDQGKAVDYRFLETNPAFLRQTGLSNVIGQHALDLVPNLEPFWFDTYGHVAKTGQAIRFDHQALAMDRSYDVYAFRVDEPNQNHIAVLFNDISERRRHEDNLAFLAEVSQDLVQLTSINETMNNLSAKIGAHFGLSRFVFAEVDEDHLTANITHDWHGEDLPDIRGLHPLSDFVGKELGKAARAGEAFIVRDTATDGRVDGQTVASVGIGSFVHVPLVQDGQWRFSMAIHRTTSYDWRNDEIELMRQLTDRIGTRLERARAEEALRESQKRLQLALDASGMGTFLWYPQEDRTEADARAFTLLGLNQNDTITLAEALAERIHPDDRQLYAAAVASAIDGNSDGKLDLDYRIVQPDGSLHWLHIYGRTFFSGETPLRAKLMYGLFLDITQRKRHQANLAFLAEVSRDLVHLKTIDETMTALGAKIGRHFMATRCAFFDFNEAMDEAVCQYDWHAVNEPSLVGSYRTSDFYTDEFLQIMRAGEAFVVRDRAADSRADAANLAGLNIASCIVIPIIAGRELLFVLSINDSQIRDWRDDEIELIREITSRIWARIEGARAEEALWESEEKFRLLSIASSDSIYIMNADWTQMQQLVGKRFLADTTDPNATWLQNYIPFEDQPQVQQVIQEAIRARSTFELEHRVLRADATVGWTFSRAIPLLDEQGAIREWLGAASDITARKQAEEALRVSDRRKSEFLAMLAHELRNPMATLHNTVLLLEITHGQDESLPLDSALGMMSREVTHLNRMIDDLLDVSRISQGKIQLRKERLDLGKLIREALEAARSQFASRGQALTMHVSEEPVWVDGDATRLTQVVRNLATNAIKYTPSGGQIEVTLEKERAQAVVRIRDNGIGIAAGQLKAIFEVFVQVSTSLDRPQGGLGLGLAVVKELVELHGGYVGAYSPGLGQGSEFTISLPRLLDGPPQGASAGRGDQRATKADRILVVDDNADLALTTAMLLRHKQYEAHTRLNGPDALEAVESLQPAAILLDLGMPGMDGFETCRRLRALEWGKHGVIVALSGYGQEDDKQRTRESGFDGHLVKPLNLQALTELLNKLLKTKN